jgi:hypothetical protein
MGLVLSTSRPWSRSGLWGRGRPEERSCSSAHCSSALSSGSRTVLRLIYYRATCCSRRWRPPRPPSIPRPTTASPYLPARWSRLPKCLVAGGKGVALREVTAGQGQSPTPARQDCTALVVGNTVLMWRCAVARACAPPCVVRSQFSAAGPPARGPSRTDAPSDRVRVGVVPRRVEAAPPDPAAHGASNPRRRSRRVGAAQAQRSRLRPMSPRWRACPLQDAARNIGPWSECRHTHQ